MFIWLEDVGRSGNGGGRTAIFSDVLSPVTVLCTTAVPRLLTVLHQALSVKVGREIASENKRVACIAVPLQVGEAS